MFTLNTNYSLSGAMHSKLYLQKVHIAFVIFSTYVQIK